jgi:hypothetical protein
VPCERVFSGTKQIATDRRARLGPETFEELTIMGSTWRANIYNTAAWNATHVEEVGLHDFEQMLVDDVDAVEWDKDFHEAWSNDFDLVV